MTTNNPKHDFFPKLISHKTGEIRISAIKEMAMLSAKIKDAASLAWGLPSFRTPEYIRNGVMEQLTRDPEIGMYSLPDGLKELRRLVARRHFIETGVTASR